jgi:hypothetical protein
MIEDAFSMGFVLLPLVDTMEGLLEPLCLSKSLSVSVFGCRPAGESVSFTPEGGGVCPGDLEHINAGPSCHCLRGLCRSDPGTRQDKKIL